MERDLPDPDVVNPIPGIGYVTHVRPTVRDPHIVVGDFTYFSDRDFESHVTHRYDFYGDKLIIGKFCQIGKNVEFVMNGANHRRDCVSTFPFYIFEGWGEEAPPLAAMGSKGDTVIGNDVWIGQDVTILPGVRVGDGAIIGMKSVVGSDVPPYTVVAGNPARALRRRFDDELIAILERLRWWDRPIGEIKALIPLLHSGDLAAVREKLRNY
ncbi:MAG: CatB-related O-acetyltransferase [Puniceicoccales bacterium]|jgi:virginiamycin A acetyltransferase|nr:CatB-related O-acetyltransferase [Puniceicoccales bacterium]